MPFSTWSENYVHVLAGNIRFCSFLSLFAYYKKKSTTTSTTMASYERRIHSNTSNFSSKTAINLKLVFFMALFGKFEISLHHIK